MANARCFLNPRCGAKSFYAVTRLIREMLQIANVFKDYYYLDLLYGSSTICE